MGKAAEKSSLDNVFRERESANATNDNEEGLARVDELLDDVWVTPISNSTVVRKAKRVRCNPARMRPLLPHIELPSVKPVSSRWSALRTPDDELPFVELTPERARLLASSESGTPTPWQLQDIGVPRKVDEAYVRERLERANGQPQQVRCIPEWRDKEVRARLRHLVEDCAVPLDLKELVDREYPRLLAPLQYVMKFDANDQERQPPEEPIRELTDAERMVLKTHEPLLVSLAKKYSRGPNSVNQTRFADLMDVGLQEMVRRIPEWDPTRKVTIGAYLKPFISGAMEERIRRQMPTSTMAHDDVPRLVDENVERWKLESGLDCLDGVAAHRRRLKAGKRKVRATARTPPKLKPKPDIPDARENALGRLTERQFAIYQNERLAKPFSGREMARRLGIGETTYRDERNKVVRILKQTM
jgi:Sigma-70 region 2